VNAVGTAAATYVTTHIHTVDGRDLCRVHVRPSGHPVRAKVTIVDAQGQHQKSERFFVRLNNGTRAIDDPAEVERSIASHWAAATDGDGAAPNAAQVVFEDGKWNGKTVREWLPVAVDDVVRAFDPVQVIVFGSVARGEEDPESDLDLLVVLDEVEPRRKRETMSAVHRAITAPVPVDVLVTDSEELARRKDVNGSVYYWPSREGEIVYERPVA